MTALSLHHRGDRHPPPEGPWQGAWPELRGLLLASAVWGRAAPPSACPEEFTEIRRHTALWSINHMRGKGLEATDSFTEVVSCAADIHEGKFICHVSHLFGHRFFLAGDLQG